MSKVSRVSGESAFVLHHHDWSESSLIVEMFTRSYGKVVVVARGAKKPSSNFRPVLLPMQALLVTWTGQEQVRSLRAAEWAGGPVMPTSSRDGQALLAGYYASELVLRLLAREDPHTRLFDGFAQLMHVLANTQTGVLDAQGEPIWSTAQTPLASVRTAALRAFELLLMREAGWLPALDKVAPGHAPIGADGAYHLSSESGLLAVSQSSEQGALPGQCWLGLEHALGLTRPLSAAMTFILTWQPQQRSQLRQMLSPVLQHHCGGYPFRTRQLLQEINAL